MTTGIDSRSPINLIMNPKDRSDESVWRFTKNDSTYSFPIRLTETTQNGDYYRVDLEARGAMPPAKCIHLDVESAKITKNVESIIKEHAGKFTHVQELYKYLIQTPFPQTTPQETIRFNLKLSEKRPAKMHLTQ